MDSRTMHGRGGNPNVENEKCASFVRIGDEEVFGGVMELQFQ